MTIVVHCISNVDLVWFPGDKVIKCLVRNFFLLSGIMVWYSSIAYWVLLSIWKILYAYIIFSNVVVTLILTPLLLRNGWKCLTATYSLWYSFGDYLKLQTGQITLFYRSIAYTNTDFIGYLTLFLDWLHTFLAIELFNYL